MPLFTAKTLLFGSCLFFYFSLFTFYLFLVSQAGAAPTKEDIAKWVQQLGDKSFATRQKATNLLWAAGEAAEPALRDALKSDDLEVVRRAKEILEKFKYGIYPDTPASVLKLIEQYRSGNQNTRQQSIAALLKLGCPGYRVLLKLAQTEANADVRRSLMEQIAYEAAQTAQAKIAAGQLDAAADLLDMGLASQTEPAMRSYAAFHLVRGDVDAKIRDFQVLVGKSGDKQAAAVLVYLYRAKGDLQRAAFAAKQAGTTALLENILNEQGDWKALAKLLGPKSDRAVSAPIKATIYRLAGDQAVFAAELHKFAGATDRDSIDALFFNDRPQEAIAALGKAKQYIRAFEFLTLQMKYREAFALIEKAPAIPADDLPALETVEARTYYRLGIQDTALQLFAKVGNEIKATKNSGTQAAQYWALIKTEYELGLKNQALEHSGQLLAVLKSQLSRRGMPFDVRSTTLMSILFPDNAASAEVWFTFLQQKFPKDKPAHTLKRVRELLDAKAAPKGFAGLARDAEKVAVKLPEQEHLHWVQAIGDTLLAFGLEAEAQTCWENAAKELGGQSAARTSVCVRLGDLHGKKRRWREAATWYREACHAAPRQALSLFLLGWALVKNGQKEEGLKLMDRSHWLPLANDQARSEYARALAERGLIQDARREQETIIRTGSFQSLYVANSRARLARDAVLRKDYLQAADSYEHILVQLQELGGYFSKPQAYLVVPYWVHFYRAWGMVKAGLNADARKEIQLCQEALPGDVDLPISLVPELEKRGNRKEADVLFNRTFAFHAQLCADYPQSAIWHNSLAWLAARCRRRLDQAFEHARKAVELDPKNAGFLDTLAEVYFQRGDNKKALELMKKCVELEPRKAYFQKQLKRFEAGNPAADVPPEAEVGE